MLKFMDMLMIAFGGELRFLRTGYFFIRLIKE
jgi:hypothetical protein